MGLNGKHVIHKTLGLGTIFNRADNMISIHFPDAPGGAKNSTFIIPSAFGSGFLEAWDNETKIALEETIAESTCSICGKWVNKTVYIDGKHLCSKCEVEHTKRCSHCGKQYLYDQSQGDMYYLDYSNSSRLSRVYLCPECIPLETFICIRCKRRHLKSELVDEKYAPKTSLLCRSCVRTCTICKRKVDDEHAAKKFGAIDCWCPDCYASIQKHKAENAPIKNQPSKKHPVANVSKGETLYIYKGQIICRQQHHTLIAATGILCTKRGEEIRLDIQYCTQCNRYLMEYTSYQYYKNLYGVLIGNIKMIGSGAYDGEPSMAEESPLKLCGYNVSQADGLTESERHYILAKMIHNGIVSKTEAIRYLKHFINMNGAKEGNELARSKWQNDLAFVHRYRIDTQPEVYINAVEKY